MRASTFTLFVSLFAISAHTREIPANLKAFYDKQINGACPKSQRLSSAFEDGQTSAKDVYYCQTNPKSTYKNSSKLKAATNIVYLKGPDKNYADLDIDCDGNNHLLGRCSDDQTGSPDTAFQDTVKEYGVGVSNLDAHVHTYVVFGNEGDKPAWDPRSVGIEPLSLVVVVCGGKLVYGIWGDTNGGVVTGEASLATGQMCFGDDAVSGNVGHTAHDVLYIAFSGAEAVPGAKGAKWNATTKEEFEASLASLGDKLVASL